MKRQRTARQRIEHGWYICTICDRPVLQVNTRVMVVGPMPSHHDSPYVHDECAELIEQGGGR